MLFKWRIVLKQAEEALKAGRLEEAYRLASGTRVREFRGARRLLTRIAEAFARRANQRLLSGQSSAAWDDLRYAERLGARPRHVTSLRNELSQRQIDEAHQYLQAGQPDAALAALEKLQRHGTIGAEGRRLKQVAATWQAGREQLQRGEFPLARQSLQEAAGLFPQCASLEQCRSQAASAAGAAPAMLHAVTQALQQEQWAEVIQAAQPLLAVAPKHPIALRVTRQAWEHLGALGPSEANGKQKGQPMVPPFEAEVADVPRVHAPDSQTNSAPPVSPEDPAGRFLLWVDAVGGYLVCPGDRVTIGQPGGSADVPILGDVSAQHATFLRDDEGWVIEPHRSVMLGNKNIERPTPLRDGDELLLGTAVRLRFRQPTPLSTTARLEFASRHRLLWAVDAVLLLGDTCMLGPRLQNHVVCPHWRGQVVIYRQGDELCCRAEEPIEIDGRAVGHRGVLHETAKVRGEKFSFTLEPVVTAASPV